MVMDEKHVLDLLQKYKSAPDSSRPDIFTDLVHSLRKFSHPQLNNLFYNQIKDNELQNLVLDALPLLKTDAGITLMKDLIDSKKLPGDILDIWFSTLPYYHNPTRSMLVTAAVSKNLVFFNISILLCESASVLMQILFIQHQIWFWVSSMNFFRSK